MTLNDIAARCSKFSGFNLQVKVEAGAVKTVTFFDPEDTTLGSQSRLVLYAGIGGLSIRESYGRMSHWAITPEEQQVILQELKASN